MPWRTCIVDCSMTELNKMEEEEEQGFLEDVDTLQTAEEHAGNLAILKDQKEQRIKWVDARSFLFSGVECLLMWTDPNHHYRS